MRDLGRSRAYVSHRAHAAVGVDSTSRPPPQPPLGRLTRPCSILTSRSRSCRACPRSSSFSSSPLPFCPLAAQPSSSAKIRCVHVLPCLCLHAAYRHPPLSRRRAVAFLDLDRSSALSRLVVPRSSYWRRALRWLTSWRASPSSARSSSLEGSGTAGWRRPRGAACRSSSGPA